MPGLKPAFLDAGLICFVPRYVPLSLPGELYHSPRLLEAGTASGIQQRQNTGFCDYFTHVGSRALEHRMIDQLTQLKFPRLSQKTSETRTAGLSQTGLGTRLARANGTISVSSPVSCLTGTSHRIPPQIVLSLPVCRNKNRKWKITTSSFTVQCNTELLGVALT